MTIKNTAENYGLVAKWLHWLTAALFLGAYCAVYYRRWFTEDKTPENWAALQLHLSIGISIAVIVTLRILWKTANQTPKLEPAPPLAHLTTRIGHAMLYLIMIVAPITGYIGTGVSTDYFFMLEIPKFEETYLFSVLVQDGLGMTFEAFEEIVDFIHKDILGKWLVWLLILGHVSAALYHHFIRKDRTLSKMTSGKSFSSAERP